MLSYAPYSDTVCKAFHLSLRRTRHLERTERLLPPEHPVTTAMPRTAMKETQYSLTSKSSKSFIPKRSMNSYICSVESFDLHTVLRVTMNVLLLIFFNLTHIRQFPETDKTQTFFDRSNKHNARREDDTMTTNSGNCRQVGRGRDGWRTATRKALILLW